MFKSLFGFGTGKPEPRASTADSSERLDWNETDRDMYERGMLIEKSLELADAFCALLPVFERAAIFSPQEFAQVEKAVRDFEGQRAKVFGP